MEGILVHKPGSIKAQTPGGGRVRNQAEDLGHSGTKHLRISGSMFCILDVGLSQLMPNTRQLDRFFPCDTKLQNSHICSQRSYMAKLLKRLNT